MSCKNCKSDLSKYVSGYISGEYKFCSICGIESPLNMQNPDNEYLSSATQENLVTTFTKPKFVFNYRIFEFPEHLLPRTEELEMKLIEACSKALKEFSQKQVG